MWRLLKEEFGRNPLRQLTAQRPNPVSAEKRVAICRARGAKIESWRDRPDGDILGRGGIDPPRGCPGNNQNLPIWMEMGRLESLTTSSREEKERGEVGDA